MGPHLRGEPRPTLTPTEMRVMRLRAQGMTIPEVADHLGIARQTVKNHVLHAFDRLDVTNDRVRPSVAVMMEALGKLGWLKVPE